MTERTGPTVNEALQDKQRKRKRVVEEQERDDLRAVLETPQGVRVIRSIVQRCHCFDSSFTSDSISMAALEGERAIGLWLLDAVGTHVPHRMADVLLPETQEEIRDDDTE